MDTKTVIALIVAWAWAGLPLAWGVFADAA